MPESLSDRILASLPEVALLYHRLVIVAMPQGSGKTTALREVSRRLGRPYVNVNLELSRRLLDLTGRQRALQVPSLLGEIGAASGADVVLIDNIEILFDVGLKLDPLQCLRGLARNRTLVVAWSGGVSADRNQQSQLSYAEPDHPEYRRYPASDLVLITPMVTA